MIDVAEKERTSRVAVARAELRCSREALKLLNEGRLEKGDALAAARLAGLMAAKRTPDFLPLCHPIAIHGADVEVAADEKQGLVRIEARVHAVDRTGVEMEALTAACAAALTVYDMMKRHDRGMELISLRLVHKSGGRTGEWNRAGEDLRIGTLLRNVPQAGASGAANGRGATPEVTPARGSKKVNR
jgi:cyclic pyranopterin phosphate synthase